MPLRKVTFSGTAAVICRLTQMPQHTFPDAARNNANKIVPPYRQSALIQYLQCKTWNHLNCCVPFTKIALD